MQLSRALFPLFLISLNAHAALPELPQVLRHEYACSASLSLRTQAFQPEQERSTCAMLGQIEARFHALFGTANKPVAHDGNRSLRANIYASREDFEKYAGAHFAMPVDNGGMYLEGLPDQPGNQAEFVASQKKDGSVRNLGHEYVHYLDGRFNLYGDFCAGLHDSHGAPENCPKPAPLTPYLVWWTEGVAEYLAKGDIYPEAFQEAAKNTYRFSELLDTGYESNNGVERTYPWGTSLDAEFALWLKSLK
jgi:Collagenase